MLIEIGKVKKNLHISYFSLLRLMQYSLGKKFCFCGINKNGFDINLIQSFNIVETSFKSHFLFVVF